VDFFFLISRTENVVSFVAPAHVAVEMIFIGSAPTVCNQHYRCRPASGREMWKRYNTAIVFLWRNKIQAHMTAQGCCLISALRCRVNIPADNDLWWRMTSTCRFVSIEFLPMGYLAQYSWGSKRL